MFQFRSEKITENIRRIYGFSEEQMYLIEGGKRAALIDTGTGVGDLRGYVEEFTDKEIAVILTHGHLDHALGAAPFDTIYMNRRDDGVFTRHKETAFRELYYKSMPGYGALEPEDYAEPMDLDWVNNLEDNMVFDPGGLTLRILALPGHTPGSMTVLVEEERLLILGDACNPFTFLFFPEALPLTEYEKNLKFYRERVKGTFDRVLFSHGSVEEMCADIIDNVIAACDLVTAGKAVNMPVTFVDGTTGMTAKETNEQFTDAAGLYGNIVYNPRRI